MSVNGVEHPVEDHIHPSNGVHPDILESRSDSFVDISPFVKDVPGSPFTMNSGSFSDFKVTTNRSYPYIAINGGNSLARQEGEKKAGAYLEVKNDASSVEKHDVNSSTLAEELENGKWANNLEARGSVVELKSMPPLETPQKSNVHIPCSTPKVSQVDFAEDQENDLLLEFPADIETTWKPKQDISSNSHHIDMSAALRLEGPPPPGSSRSPGPDGPSLGREGISLDEAVSSRGNTVLAPAEKLWSCIREEAVKLRICESGPGSEDPVTISQMFQQVVERHGDHPALCAKTNGEWEILTYKEYYLQCRSAAKSFLKLGLERYRGVGILGFNSPEWFIANIGSILAGGLAAGIYTTNSPEACQYVAHNCEANVLVVENRKQLEKILKVKDQLPHLKAIVQYKDELEEKLPNLYTWKEFLELGEDVPDEDLDEISNSQKANQCCTLIYTSGTTGQPKGVMLSHDNLTWVAYAAGSMVKLKERTEVVVSYLPLSHVAAQVNDMWLAMRFAATVYFADPDALKGSLVNTLREVRPTSFLGVPRVWEKMQEKMKAVGAKSSFVRRMVADWAKYIGLQAGYNFMNGNESVPWGFMLANNLVFKKVKAALGLDRCTRCFTGAAPITKDTLEYFMSLNIPVFELYGMSESTGPHTVSHEAAYHIMSCGKVIPGCSTKLDKPDQDGTGEICFWGRHVFMGYLNMPDKTEETLDQEGWLHSGDLGKHDQDGFLYITGRIKELIITAGGENIPPVPIEDAVKEELPVISNAMLVGDKRKFLSVLLTLKSNVDDSGDPLDQLTPHAVEFFKQLDCKATRVSEITANMNPSVFKAIQDGIDRVNSRATSNAQKIQKWTILQRDFSISGGELGPTMKLKRPVVHKMYKEEIEKFYTE
nr:PREDICTED: long-chain-fatty-acid--CoA ligase ACSBG2-like isoform X1 [Lepisosteus oculatus]XP_015195068.1 PREDICTED: long-chain-fatty-acid--CoA ligase ACSBG2-like isoform X1 [Lepisosteus oculatus]XP_015195074.1 PREDICTED: long-chain-fatty-acid--CoA ligase ACSBG2-like isoform X1 [Lepisosteus oculatus]XP_015195078.1 PREDICTED: long-chain-fatty-acid--CoA ligase ACSBG2-like isoform X1 [Lepisosteus oculatus]